MYSGMEKSVKLPKKGRLHILRNGYVYWEDDGKWDNEKKMTVDSRVSIGKLDPKDPGMMFPNRRYGEIFRPRPEPKVSLPGQFSKVLSFGPWVALKAASDLSGCSDALRDAFPARWQQIMALAMHAIDAESSTAQDFPYWAFHNYCGMPASMSSGEISTLYEELAEDDCAGISDFMGRYRQNYQRLLKGTGECVVGFDSTNQNTSAKGMAMAEYGHPKKKAGIPDVSTALFTDEATGIPLYYEHFYGSILDKTETPYTVEKARDLGYRKLFVMMDRGYYSRETIGALSDMEFGLMCPDTLSLVDEMINAHASEIRDNESCFIAGENAYGMHFPGASVAGGSYDAYLFYDSVRAMQERESIHRKLDYLAKCARQKKRYSESLRERFLPYLSIAASEKDVETGRNFTVSVNPSAVQPQIDKAGLFVIVSNAGYSAAEMLGIARKRDCNEKDFRRIKSHFGFDTPHTHILPTYEGKAFVTFVALAICESYRWFCRETIRSSSSVTTATSLGELRKYQIMRKSDGTWMPMYAMTSKQKDLFKSLGLDSKKIEEMAREVIIRV